MGKRLFIHLLTTLFFCLFLPLQATENELLLRDNLQRAQPGDFIVTLQNKNNTLLLVRSKDENYIGIDEITVPSTRIPQKGFSWRNWVEKGAPGSTCWVMYMIHLPTGTIQQTYSFTKKEWVTVPQSQNFLSTLLNLQLHLVSEGDRKKVGPPPSKDSPDRRNVWQPQLIVDGQKIPGIKFNAWRTRWPKDTTELSGRTIEVYLPADSVKYPSYFPYWLQISGMIGKAKVRIIDSGSQLYSSAKVPN